MTKIKTRKKIPPIEFLLRMYRDMATIRAFEEETERLYSSGHMPGVVHLYSGQEAVAVGVCAALKIDDYIASHHRGHGHCLAKGAKVKGMFAELMGRSSGYCKGRGGSMHIADPSTGNLGASGIVGGGIPIAAGAALSAKLRGTNQVAVCFFGDGALNQGIFFETMNVASVWSLPLVFVCENNLYGEFTASENVTAGKRWSSRGRVFDVPSREVDGMDVLAVYRSARSAVRRARAGKGSSFLVYNTYRFKGHHAGDRKQDYKRAREEDNWSKRDPIPNFSGWLVSQNLVERTVLESIDREVKEKIIEGSAFAEGAPEPDEGALFEDIYAE